MDIGGPSPEPIPAHQIGSPVGLDDPRVEQIRATLGGDAQIVRAFISTVAAGHREPVHRHELQYAAMFLTTGRAYATAADGHVLNPIDLVAGTIKRFDNVPIDHSLRAPDDVEASYLAVEYELLPAPRRRY